MRTQGIIVALLWMLSTLFDTALAGALDRELIPPMQPGSVVLHESAYIDSPSFSSNETISVLGSLRKAGSFWASHLRAPTTWRTRASSDDTSRAHLDGHGIFAIIVFAAVSLVVIAPLQIPIPFAVSRPIRRAARRLLGHKQDDDGTAAPTSDAARKRRNSEEDAPEEQTSSPTHVAPDSSSQDVKQAEERTYLPLNHVSAPIIGCLLLLATKTIGGEQVRAGIVGEEGVEPYDVLALFISLAYIAISLDATGLLRFLAFHVCLRAGSSGKRLYLLLYAFFWTAGVLVGNDPVILSGTAFLVYFTRIAGISPPSAWIWAQFVAANISSAVLVSSNPTNLVIASGFDISFPTYTSYMVLPSFASALAALVTLMFLFRNRPNPIGEPSKGKSSASKMTGTLSRITRSIPGASHLRKRRQLANASPPGDHSGREGRDHEDGVAQHPTIFIPPSMIRPDVDPRAALVDPKGAIFNSVIMAATLVLLVATSVIGGVKVYMVAVPGAVICFARDAICDWLRWRRERSSRVAELEQDAASIGGHRHASQSHEAGTSQALDGEVIELGPMASKSNNEAPDTAKDEDKQSPASPPSPGDKASTNSAPSPSTPTSAPPRSGLPTTRRGPLLRQIMSYPSSVSRVFPTVAAVMARLPLPLLPFAFGMFILVQGLAHVGFINIMAAGLGRVCAHGVTATAFFMATLGVILCNLGGTNIGATILLTKALQSSAFQSSLTPSSRALILKSALYSVAFGSNVGALGGTFAASLAGLLWRSGLKQGGVTVSAKQFAIWCAAIIVPATAAGVGVLLAEVVHFHTGE